MIEERIRNFRENTRSFIGFYMIVPQLELMITVPAFLLALISSFLELQLVFACLSSLWG